MAMSPPAFNPASSKSGSKLWLWLIIAFVAFCVILIAGIFFVSKMLLGTGMEFLSCRMNGELATNAVLAYAKDHDGQLPDGDSWQDDVRPYYEKLYDKVARDFIDEDVPDIVSIDIAKPGQVLRCSTGSDFKTGFAYNSLLAGTNTADYDYPRDTVLIWETTNPGYNAHGDPSTRGDDSTSPKIFGDERGWMDFSLAGDSDSRQPNQGQFNFDISPDDALDGPPTESDPDEGTTDE